MRSSGFLLFSILLHVAVAIAFLFSPGQMVASEQPASISVPEPEEKNVIPEVGDEPALPTPEKVAVAAPVAPPEVITAPEVPKSPAKSKKVRALPPVETKAAVIAAPTPAPQAKDEDQEIPTHEEIAAPAPAPAEAAPVFQKVKEVANGVAADTETEAKSEAVQAAQDDQASPADERADAEGK